MRCQWGWIWSRISRCDVLFATYEAALVHRALSNTICLEEITLA
jgi:hypothetical protein